MSESCPETYAQLSNTNSCSRTGANLDVSEHENITFTRRYLDANRVTYEVREPGFLRTRGRLMPCDSTIPVRATRRTTRHRVRT